MSVVLTWIAHASVLVACAAIAIHAARGLNAVTRYYLWWTVMAAVLALPAAHGLASTFSEAFSAAPSPSDAASLVAPIDPESLPLLTVPRAVADAGPWLAVLLGLIVGWRVLALGVAAARVRRVRVRCRPLPIALEAKLRMWRDAQGLGRAPQLLVTADLPTPAVLAPTPGDDGRPIIALPEWTIESLDAESLDLIVLHELAHVERGDDRDLLIQAAIEAVFGWHPAVWWIGRQLNEERERACDDEVVRRTNRATQYARCLVGVAAHVTQGSKFRTCPAAAGRAGRHLAARVERLLSTPPAPQAAASGALRVSWLGGGVTTLTVAVVVLAVGAPRVHVLEANWDRMRTSSMLAFADPADAGTPVVRQPSASSSISLPILGIVSVRTPTPSAFRRAPEATLPHAPHVTPFTLSPGLPPPAAPDLTVGSSPQPSVDRPPIAGGLLPATPVTRPFMLTAVTPAVSPASAPPASPWKRTADAGGSIGKGAAQAGESLGKGAASAGVKTAGFFTRMGRAVASSF